MSQVNTLPPGFRFHPTDEELIAYYLKKKINGHTIELEIIPEVDLYKCEPWDLPEKSFLPSKDLEWYFFSPRDRKYPNGSRTNRATQAGYWKATGKDRKVSSQKRSVGMKKTLVYYTGRAPHGSRTNWVMHEYRLDEKECETANGLQDAYALCRVFKKSAPGPKIIEHYGAQYQPHSHWMVDDRSLAVDLSPDAGVDELESNAFAFQSENCSSNTTQGVMFDTSASTESKWMQFLAEDVFSSAALSFQNHSGLPYVPSKVDVALECARLQHRLSLPPLEVEDFPQFDPTDSKVSYSDFLQGNNPEADILQEILSVAVASQELINNSIYHDPWTGCDPCNDKFEFAPLMDPAQFGEMDGFGSSRSIRKSFAVGDDTRFVEISELEEEFREEKKEVENLRGVGVSNANMTKINLESTSLRANDVLNHQIGERTNTQGETELCDTGYNTIYSQSHSDDFSTGFINFQDYGYSQEEQIMDVSAMMPNFDDVYGKIISNQQLFVSQKGASKTFFHQIEPLEKICFHVNPISRQVTVEKFEFPAKKRDSFDFFIKLKAFIREHFKDIQIPVKAWRGYLHNERHMGSSLKAHVMRGERRNEYCSGMKKDKKMRGSKWRDNNDSIWFPSIRGKGISNMFLNGKWSFLSTALAPYY